MSFVSYDSGSRYRRKAAERRRRLTFVLITIVIFFAIGYWLGGEVVRSSELAFKQRAIKLQNNNDSLEKKIADLRAKVEETQLRYKQLSEKYKREVPTGELRELTGLVAAQLKDGIKKERLAFVITSARPPRNCTAPKTKRFIVRTPAYRGPISSVAFAKGVVTVTGSGASAVNANGKKEAWFDASKPVKIKFTQVGGKDTIKEQLLPIHYSMIVNNREYRFTIAKGPRSFVTVTADSCDYP